MTQTFFFSENYTAFFPYKLQNNSRDFMKIDIWVNQLFSHQNEGNENEFSKSKRNVLK